MEDFGVVEAANILGMSERQVRRCVQDGLVDSLKSGPSGRRPPSELRFGFQDLVLLRTAKGLLDARVPRRRIRRALAALRGRLPEGQPLSGVQIVLEGGELVVRDASGSWVPESGQVLFEFGGRSGSEVSPLEAQLFAGLAPDVDQDDPVGSAGFTGALSLRPLREGGPDGVLDREDEATEMDASDWMDLADAYDEDHRPAQARDAMRRALECDPFELEARLRLGRMLEQEGRLRSAEAQYRVARRLFPEDPDSALDHGRLLAQLGAFEESLQAFEWAKELDPGLDEAYLGAADMHERLGRSQEALRLLSEVRSRRTPPED